jgi:hypothetical protein
MSPPAGEILRQMVDNHMQASSLAGGISVGT